MILRLIGRLLVVFIGFSLAALACFALLTYLGGQMLSTEIAGSQDIEGAFPEPVMDVFGAFAFMLAIYPATTILPAIIAIIIGEVGRIRSILYYVLAGGAASLAIPLLYVATNVADVDMPTQSLLMIFATAGFGAGLVYWLIAGRTA